MNARAFFSSVMSLCHRRGQAPIVWILSLAVLVWPAGAQPCHPQPPFDPPLGWWEPVINWPVEAVHLIHLPASQVSNSPYGKLLFWNFHGNAAYLWDPGNCSFTSVPVNASIFCAGHAALAEGGVLVAGGTESSPNSLSFVFDPFTQTWTQMENMTYERFYPTCTTLTDGKILTLSGTDYQGIVEIGEIYKHPNSWEVLPDSSAQALHLYPFVFTLNRDRVVAAGPDEETRVLNFQTMTWTQVATSTFGGGSAAMYQPGRILKSGGHDFGAVDDSAIIDMNASVPAWTATDPMNIPRTNHNLTILPDGTVLTTGGEDDIAEPVFEAEKFNPDDNSWTTLAAMDDPRQYHSTATLLPDGRVVAAGGNGFATAQIYWPPYLFNGAQPQILSAPLQIGYAEVFQVTTPDTSIIKRVTLVRLGAATHSFDQNQRFAELGFEVADDMTLVVTGPRRPGIAPPGYYMLFIINDDGVPSFARYLRIG